MASLTALYSNTLGEGLECLVRYKHMVYPEKVWLDIGYGEARLRFQWLLGQEEPPALLIVLKII